ncbi:TlpA family protein disulfide reductase, partial [Myxococcota bacterium]
LESRQYAVLADVFRAALHLSYPVVMADPETRSGQGPFGAIRRVPTVVVLDRSGREVWRGEGLVDSVELEGALQRASQAGPDGGGRPR